MLALQYGENSDISSEDVNLALKQKVQIYKLLRMIVYMYECVCVCMWTHGHINAPRKREGLLVYCLPTTSHSNLMQIYTN